MCLACARGSALGRNVLVHSVYAQGDQGHDGKTETSWSMLRVRCHSTIVVRSPAQPIVAKLQVPAALEIERDKEECDGRCRPDQDPADIA